MQEVIAAMTTAPWATCAVTRPSMIGAVLAGSPEAFWPSISTRELSKIFLASFRGTRSCGRFGPASDGSTVERSSSIVSVKRGSGAWSVLKSPCSFV